MKKKSERDCLGRYLFMSGQGNPFFGTCRPSDYRLAALFDERFSEG